MRDVETVSPAEDLGMRGEDKPSFGRDIILWVFAHKGDFLRNPVLLPFAGALCSRKGWPADGLGFRRRLSFGRRFPSGGIENHRSFNVFRGQGFRRRGS